MLSYYLALLTEELAACHPWCGIKLFQEPEQQPQPYSQGDGCPACTPALLHSPWAHHMWTCLGCSVIQMLEMLRDLRSPVLPKQPGDSTFSPSNKFTLLKFLFLAMILACNSLSSTLFGCLCTSNLLLFGCFTSSPFFEKAFMRAFLILGHLFQVLCHLPV